MNRVEMVEKVAEIMKSSKTAAAEVVGMFFDAETGIIAEALKAGGDVKIQGFGTFHVSDRAERKGVNPKTGAAITIAATRTPKFKAGSTLRGTVK